MTQLGPQRVPHLVNNEGDNGYADEDGEAMTITRDDDDDVGHGDGCMVNGDS